MKPEIQIADLGWDEERQVPASQRFQDVYHSCSGALAQARHVFMGGCELPQRWQGKNVFTIVETGFGLGLNLLATWQAWLDDPERCSRLHFLSIEAYPVTADQLLHCVTRSPELSSVRDLALTLASRYPNPPRPGLHRLRFPHPAHPLQVFTLTLAIGDAGQILTRLRTQADAAYLDGFSPAKNPDIWQPHIFKGVARLLKPQALAATWSIAAMVRQGLTQAGFELKRRPGLPPKRDALQALYRPWNLRKPSAASLPQSPSHGGENNERQALVIGAGLAGAAACWSLSQRGWRVTLIDAGAGAASGASGLPVGLAVPHLSPDDAVVSRLTRNGCHWMRQILDDIQLAPEAWQSRTVWQVLDSAQSALPEDANDMPSPQDDPLTQARVSALGGLQAASLPGGYQGAAVAHDTGLCIKGPALIAHWLTQCPGLQTLWQRRVMHLRRVAQDGSTHQWQALDADGLVIAQAQLVVVASAMSATTLAPMQLDDASRPQANSPQPTPLLTPLRGQITLGHWPKDDQAASAPTAALPGLTGHGHFIANWTQQQCAQGTQEWDWSMGSSFERNDEDRTPRMASDQENLLKLSRLAPQLATLLSPQFAATDKPSWLQPWVEVRATTADRLPMAGAVPDWSAVQATAGQDTTIEHALQGTGLRKPAKAAWTLDNLPRLPGLYMVCGLGARGLSLAALCAELLASQIEGEPWPLDTLLAQAMDPARFELKRLRQSASA